MKYMGSKSRIAKAIVPILQKDIEEKGIKKYVEPFAGGMNIMDKISCEVKIASDVNPYLIALFKHLTTGGDLHKEVPRELYNDVRRSFREKDGKYKEWEYGNIGFLASYNGRFFDGGYAKKGFVKTKKGLRERDYYSESSRNILEQIPKLTNVIFENRDYSYWKDLKGCLIYCDPPYKNTQKYNFDFDHEEFWDFIRDISVNNVVYVSEESAPDDFDIVWEKEVSRSINAGKKSKASEKLYRFKNGR